MVSPDPHHDFQQVAQDLLSAVASKVKPELDPDELRWQKAQPGRGDLALPCFKLAKQSGQNPVSLAQELVEAMNGALPPEVALLEAQGGFVNLQFERSFLGAMVLETITQRKADYGRGEPTGEQVLLEHTSANPTGPFHVGRARNPLIGDTLARLLTFAGAEVITEYYVNDVGRQAAVLTYGLENFPPKGKGGKVDHELVSSYRAANTALEEDPQARKAIYDLLEACESGDQSALEKMKGSAARLLEGLKESLTELNVQLDAFFFESSLLQEKKVDQVLKRLKGLKEAGEEEGAHYLDLSQFNLPSREQRFFFTRDNGLSLYTTRDLAYHISKFTRCSKGLNILGEDHKLQARQLEAALQLLGEATPEVIFYSFVNLPEGKMSTRKGRTVLIDELLEEARDRATKELLKRRPDLEEQEGKRVAEALGRSSIRFNLLKVQPEKPLTFRWEEALSFDGFAAPYLIYSHARACAILRKAGYPEPGESLAMLESEGQASQAGQWLSHASEQELMRMLGSYPGLVQEAARSYRPHALANYLYELANTFNAFYRDCPVLTAGTNEEKEARTLLVAAFRQVLAGGLELMGLDALERM